MKINRDGITEAEPEPGLSVGWWDAGDGHILLTQRRSLGVHPWILQG